MSGASREPIWVSRRVAEAIHDLQLREHGGAAGLRDSGLLESALSSPRNRWAYGDDPDLADLAAAYANALIRDHPFVDGNKRTAFLLAYVFLSVNGYDLDAPEEEVARIFWSLSEGELAEADLTRWIRHHMRSRA